VFGKICAAKIPNPLTASLCGVGAAKIDILLSCPNEIVNGAERFSNRPMVKRVCALDLEAQMEVLNL
jgi:hypothetical protein